MVAQDGGWFGGRLWSTRGEGWDRGNPCRPVRHRHGDAGGCRRTFLEGVGGDPSSRLVAYRGKPLAAVSSSSRSFLEVLIGASASL